MNSEAAIYHLLSNDSTLTAMLSTPTSIWLEVVPHGSISPQAANPCIVYQESITDTNETNDGPSELDGLKIQIDVYADSAAQRNTIAARVRTVLDGQSGTFAGVVVDSIIFGYGDKLYDDIAKCYRFTSDYYLRQKL